MCLGCYIRLGWRYDVAGRSNWQKKTYRKHRKNLKKKIQCKNVNLEKLQLIDTNFFIIIFKGRVLPNSVSLYDGLVNLRIRPYIPAVKQCYNCYRFGHTKAVCRNKVRRCVNCGEEFHGNCDSKHYYLNCGPGHKANNRGCETYDYNRQILKISATITLQLRF